MTKRHIPYRRGLFDGQNCILIFNIWSRTVKIRSRTGYTYEWLHIDLEPQQPLRILERFGRYQRVMIEWDRVRPLVLMALERERTKRKIERDIKKVRFHFSKSKKGKRWSIANLT